jgi:hypothetical protein
MPQGRRSPVRPFFRTASTGHNIRSARLIFPLCSRDRAAPPPAAPPPYPHPGTPHRLRNPPYGGGRSVWRHKKIVATLKGEGRGGGVPPPPKRSRSLQKNTRKGFAVAQRWRAGFPHDLFTASRGPRLARSPRPPLKKHGRSCHAALNSLRALVPLQVVPRASARHGTFIHGAAPTPSGRLRGPGPPSGPTYPPAARPSAPQGAPHSTCAQGRMSSPLRHTRVPL